MNHEQETMMPNPPPTPSLPPEAESSSSNQELFAHAKATLHYPEQVFI